MVWRSKCSLRTALSVVGWVTASVTPGRIDVKNQLMVGHISGVLSETEKVIESVATDYTRFF